MASLNQNQSTTWSVLLLQLRHQKDSCKTSHWDLVMRIHFQVLAVFDLCHDMLKGFCIEVGGFGLKTKKNRGIRAHSPSLACQLSMMQREGHQRLGQPDCQLRGLAGGRVESFQPWRDSAVPVKVLSSGK